MGYSIPITNRTMSAEEILRKHCFNHNGVEHNYSNSWLIAAMEEYRSQSVSSVGDKWIRFVDQKPQNYQRVLWLDNRDKAMHVDYFCHPTWPDYATHWQPLPLPPGAASSVESEKPEADQEQLWKEQP